MVTVKTGSIDLLIDLCYTIVMNIFYLSKNPIQCAQMHVDKHVVKMILELAQLLSTAHRVLDGTPIIGLSKTGRKQTRYALPDGRDSTLYSATHINHPSAVWVRESSANYDWLYTHLLALGREYTHRYSRTHLTIDKLGTILKDAPKNIKQGGLTKMPSCMGDEFKVGDDPIANYRNYYTVGKASLHRWTNRLPPQWMQGEVVIIPQDDEEDNYRTVYTIKR